jgi:nucleotide-binding universal stress UspA family protein
VIKSILVAVDGSEYARPAREYAIGLAKAYQAKVVGLYVIDVRILEMPPFISPSYPVETLSSPDPTELIEVLREHGEQVADAFREGVVAEGVAMEIRIEEGTPGQTIADLADGYDLLIMGKRGEQAKFGRDLLGSTTEAVVRRASSPVLLVDPDRHALGDFLLLYDGSHAANDALKLAADLASHLGATLRVFTAGDDEAGAGKVQDEARAYLSGFPDIVTKYRVSSGKAVIAALEELDEEPADLVVMGKHGHSAFHNLILGSTTEEFMREVSAPLLLVP